MNIKTVTVFYLRSDLVSFGTHLSKELT